jgi:hypothetical protein
MTLDAECCHAQCYLCCLFYYYAEYLYAKCLHAEFHYSENRYAEYLYSECLYAECRYAKFLYGGCFGALPNTLQELLTWQGGGSPNQESLTERESSVQIT